MRFEGSLEAPILFVTDFPRINCIAEHRVMSEALFQPLQHAIQSAGLVSSQYSFYSIHQECPPGGQDLFRISQETRSADILLAKDFIRSHRANIVVPLGEYCMNLLTGLTSIQKWHCSIVPATAEFAKVKCLPLFHPAHVAKVFSDAAYLTFGLQKIRKNMYFPELRNPARVFHLNPKLDFTLRYLKNLASREGAIAVDIETGRGQINTVGFALSPHEAIAIKTLPEDYTPEEHLELWKAIAAVLENSQPKILQNFIYEATWFARYGIQMTNTAHDTMWAMKFLHPEFDKGLDNVGRLYTDFPYWKDDNDSWNNIRDWTRHLDYNCKDTTGTFAAYLNQKQTLADRKLEKVFYDFVMHFAAPIQEMCTRGLLVDPEALIRLQEKLLGERDNYLDLINKDCMEKLNRVINPRSPKQVKDTLKAMGMKIPTQKGQESSDKKALVKLAKKYPDSLILKALIGLSAKNKQLSSYINFDYNRETNRVHYAIDGCGTETGRWSAYKSGWGEGFNPQTVPKAVRKCFIAEPGKHLVQIDLSQAESRYVAWEAADFKLMEMLSNKRDIHKYVASRIFNKNEALITDKERNLGKKSGHAANYDVGPRTFAEACLVDMDMALTEQEARHILVTYEQTFPGVRARKNQIEKTLRQYRKLTTPLGRERYFYGRMDDSTFREAYAYAPQSTIPDITNHLMLKLWEHREDLECEFLLQVHDSLLLQVPIGREFEIANLAKDLSFWHPKVMLPGGQLLIPVEVEVGTRWNPMQKI